MALTAAVTATVAALGVGAVMWWPAGLSSRAAAPARQARVSTQAAAAFTTTANISLDTRRQRAAYHAATVRAFRLKLKAERARKAARRRAAARAAAARAAARRAAAQRRARRQAAQQPQAAAPPDSAGSGSSAPSGSPQQIASAMLAGYGWGQDQFGCLDSLWSHESGWSTSASNPSSGAYGIPQALPGSKMASAGPDWQTNAATQIRWGLGYIRDLYGSPCGAWSHEQATGWY